MKNVLLLIVLSISILTLGACSSLVSSTHNGPLVEDAGERTWGRYIDDGVIESKAKINIANTSEALDESRIEPTSFNGILLLVGQIADPSLKQDASDAVKHIRHVKAIENQLTQGQRITFSQRTSDNWLATKIKWAISRNTEVGSSRVKVVTENSDVFLMGLLTRAEAQSVVEATSQVTGISKIVKVFEYLD